MDSSMFSVPEKGIAPDKLLEQLQEMKGQDIRWRDGRTWSLVYYIDDEHVRHLQKAHELFFSENPMSPFTFGSIRQLEQELVGMTAHMLHGDEEVVGSTTSGGTESIFLSLYTYRERARKVWPQIQHPEVVAPVSIHPAFEKAAHILGLRLRKAPLGPDFKVDVDQMRALISEDTILLAASSPAYPQGVQDPIQTIGELALEFHLPFHVDGCIGGYMLPWVEALGYPVQPWDFRVPGVTSICSDLHKFAYGEKGASVLLFRSMEYFKYQFFISTDWPGGMYISTTMVGTRSAGPLAAGWLAMKSLGREGYLRVAEKVMEGTKRLIDGLNAIPEIRVLGNPCMNVLSFTTVEQDPHIFGIAARLAEKGWLVDKQQSPQSIHLTIMSHNLPVIDQYLANVKEAIQFAKDHPEANGHHEAATYGLLSKVPLRSLAEKNVRAVLEELYLAGSLSGKTV